MGQIYINAERVLIWLGPSNRESDLLLEFLHNLASSEYSFKDYSAHGQRSWTSSLGKSQKFREDKSLQNVEQWLKTIHDHFDETLNPLYSLLSRPWWRRVWVQQEVALARRDNVHMACGRSMVPWKDVVIAQNRILHLLGFATNRQWARSDQSQESDERIAARLTLMNQATWGRHLQKQW